MTFELLREIIAVRRRSFGMLAFVVLVDIFLILFLSVWQNPELERTQKDWFARREAAAHGMDRSVASRYRDAERDLELFQKRLIAKKDFPAFLSELFATAKANSLAIKGITYKPAPTKEKGLFSYGIGFVVSGKYAGAKSFIADLARLPKIVTLDSVTLASSSRTEEIVDLQVHLTVYLKTEGA
jgi:type IV pilus assembly protein PilO